MKTLSLSTTRTTQSSDGGGRKHEYKTLYEVPAHKVTGLGWASIDQANGDDGDNVLYGTSTRDVLYGFGGDDFIYGGGDDDSLYGGDGDDYVTGEDGDDLIYGEDGADTLRGEDGSDILYGGAGHDDLTGGAGDDRLYGDGGRDDLNGGLGADRLYGGGGDDRLWGNDDADHLYGDGGDDRLFGGAGDDLIYGGAGDDFLVGGSGTDMLHGGDGNDTVDYSLEDRSVYVALGDFDWVPDQESGVTLHSGYARVYEPTEGLPNRKVTEILTSIENVIGGSADDVLVARTFEGSRLEGRDGDDELFGQYGNDALLAGSGDDDVLDGLGDDSVDLGSGDDVFWWNGGTDSVRGGAGADRFYIDPVREGFEYEPGDRLSFGGTLTIEDLAAADTILLDIGYGYVVDSNGNGVVDGWDEGVHVEGGNLHLRLPTDLPVTEDHPDPYVESTITLIGMTEVSADVFEIM